MKLPILTQANRLGIFSLSPTVPLTRITQLVKRKKYVADIEYFISGAVAVQSLVCSMGRAMMYKNSYGKSLMHANYG